MAGEEAAAGLPAAASGRALHDDAVRDDRSAREGEAELRVGDRGVPDQLAGLGVERDEVGVAGRDDQLVVVDRLVARAARVHLVGKLVLVFPDQLARRAVESLDQLGRVLDVDDPVMDERCLLGPPPRRHAPCPCELQLAHVVLVDLVERAVAPAVVGPPPHQPVTVGRAFASISSVTGVILSTFASCASNARRAQADPYRRSDKEMTFQRHVFLPRFETVRFRSGAMRILGTSGLDGDEACTSAQTFTPARKATPFRPRASKQKRQAVSGFFRTRSVARLRFLRLTGLCRPRPARSGLTRPISRATRESVQRSLPRVRRMHGHCRERPRVCFGASRPKKTSLGSPSDAAIR